MLETFLIDAPRPLLTSGNSKLGKIHIWSIPAVATCPGSSSVCRSRCYAARGYYGMLGVVSSLYRNLMLCASPFFVSWMVKSIQRRKASIVRIHAAGDFFSADYVRAWLRIVRACPGVQFYAYTRSWRVEEMRKLFTVFAAQPNVQLWYSCDQDTGIPTIRKEEKGVRLAYMAINMTDISPVPVELIFRDYPVRGSVQKHIAGDLVCPVENGTGAHLTCSQCQLCFSDPEEKPNKRTTGRFPGVYERPSLRIPLQLTT
jgi:hypothetical protein